MEDFAKLAENCVAQEGAESEDLEILLTRQLPSSRAGACIPACLFETLGIVSQTTFCVSVSFRLLILSILPFEFLDAR